MTRTVKVAAAQLAPVFLDREATVAKACEAILEAGRNGASQSSLPYRVQYLDLLVQFHHWSRSLQPGHYWIGTRFRSGSGGNNQHATAETRPLVTTN
jgi:hypothetical protein